MKMRLFLFFCFWPVLFAFCETFTDPFDYSTTSMSLNSTNYTPVIFNSDTGTVKFVPFGGLSIANTNGATTSTVSVIWTDGSGVKVPIFKGTVSGPTNILYIPASFDIQGTNQMIEIMLDVPMTNGLLIKHYFITSQVFTP